MQIRLTFLFLLTVFTSSNKLFPQAADSILYKANQLYQAKKYPEAIQFFNQANQYSPLPDDNLTILAKAYSKNEEYQKATEIFSELLQKEKPDIQIYYWHAVNLCYIDTADNFPSAKPFFETFIKSAEKDTLNQLNYLREAYRYMMSYHIYDTVGNKDSAVYYANKLVDISNNNITGQRAGYGGLCLIYYEKKDFINAELYCLKTLELEPENKNLKAFYRLICERRKEQSWDFWFNKMQVDSIFSLVQNSIDKPHEVSFSKESIPSFLIDTLQFWNKHFTLSSPAQVSISKKVEESNSFQRQIVFILKNEETIFIIYKNPNFPSTIHIIWSQYYNNKINLIWTGVGPGEINTTEKFKAYIRKTKNSNLYPKFL